MAAFFLSRDWIYDVHSWIVEEVVLFPDMPAGEVAWMCAVPMGMMAAGDQRTDRDVLAAWAEGLASRRDEMQGRGSTPET
jgi:hypothetical protein